MPVRRIRPIATLLVFAALVAGVLAGVVLQGAAPAAALVFDPGPFLALSPASGLPGDPVTATGSDGAVSAASSCSLLWDEPAISLPCGLDDTGALSSDFAVPPDALPGSHTVTLTSLSGSRTASFDVLTVVPDVRDGSVRDALVLMKQSGLRMVGGGADLGQLIAAEDPAPGTAVTRGSLVIVTLQAVVVTAPPPSSGGSAPHGSASGAATSAAASDSTAVTPTGASAGVTPTAATTVTTGTEPSTTPAVSASPAATTGRGGDGDGFPPLVIALVVGLVVFVAAGGGARHVRRRRLRRRVHLRPRPDGAALPTTTGAPARVPTVRLEPHSDDLVSVEVRP